VLSGRKLPGLTLSCSYGIRCSSVVFRWIVGVVGFVGVVGVVGLGRRIFFPLWTLLLPKESWVVIG
jgi:hypothetical protein